MVVLSFVLNSCEDDDASGEISPSRLDDTTVYGVVRQNGSLSNLEAALEVASGDLPETLRGEGPFTLFAPENAAFDNLATRLGFESASELLENIDPATLATILTYHVVSGDNEDDDLTEGTQLTTVQGGQLTITVVVDGDNRTIQILDATDLPETNPVSNVTVSNPDPGNGAVHIIEKVLLPQEIINAFDIDIRPSIVDLATSSDDLSVLVSALGKTNLTGTIVALDTANVLAPTNQAFLDLLEDPLGDDYDSLDDFDNDVEIALLADILRYHVLPGASNLMAGQAETALEGASVEVVADNGGFAFGDATGTNANAAIANIEARNGFVQVIDKVLLPQTALDFLAQLESADLATTVINTDELSILEQALAATELVAPFVDDSNESFVQDADEEDEDFEERRTPENFTYFKPATVFAPSNAAFEELFALLGDDYTGIDSFDTEDELALLTEILTYHVVEGDITSDDLTPGPVTTLAESEIEIVAVLGTGDFVIADASNDNNANFVLTDTDVMARNGVAHVIDKVLLPQSAVDFINSLNEEEED